MKFNRLTIVTAVMFTLFSAQSIFAQRFMENLNRGLIAVKTSGGYFLSWRLFGIEPDNIGFNAYKGTTKLNSSVITNATCFQDNTTGSGTYTVKAVVDGVEQESSEAAIVLSTNYLNIPISAPASGYTPGDASVGDLDGDGEYEIVLKLENSPQDNANDGVTKSPILDGYKLDGTRLWRIDLGINIREGAHYTQFMVYDLDGDGKAEVACKTAPGTKDGSGNYIKMGPAATAGHATDYRNSSGYILTGPEYFTVFRGPTGAELVTVDYKPPRGTVKSWGDDYGNRVDRFLACIAYLDGARPSVVMCRGYYTRSTLWALDWREGKLTERWLFDSDKDGTTYAGQGCHSLRVGDVDDDGYDEIVYGACTIDHNGKGLYTTKLGHGDALHLSDMDPDRPGLEVWQVHEDAKGNGHIAASFRDAKTGTVIWSNKDSSDNGRGMAAPLLSSKGWQMWSASPSGLFDLTGKNAGSKPSSDNFGIWWNGDPQRNLLDGNYIDKYPSGRLLTADGCSSINGTKSNSCLSADIFGDWREEVMFKTTDNTALRIYTTTTATTNRLYTLMHDPVYRQSVASENVAYNQPPEPGFYIGYGMTLPPVRPNIKLVDRKTSVSIPLPDENSDGAISYKAGLLSINSPKAGSSVNVEVFSLGGRLIFSRNVHLASDKTSADIPLSYPHNGNYLVKTTIEGRVFLQKISRIK